MFRHYWVVGAVLATALANTGCVSCCHKTYQQAWNGAPECDLPTACRGQVYLFMVDGVTPAVHGGLGALRTELGKCGFAKVGVGDVTAAPCVECEIKKLHRCEPDARFVLLGYDVGGAAAVCVARDLAAKGVPVDAVVLLDPVGCGAPTGLRTLLITSGKTNSTAPHTDRVVVSDAGHTRLPAHPATVGAITDLLHEIAERNWQPGGDPVPEWTYPSAPEMRPLPELRGGDWDFLVDQGNPSAIGTRLTATRPLGYPAAASQPATPSTAAGPVLIKR
jgi:hypothetical protein